jgi:hypothetical protein
MLNKKLYLLLSFTWGLPLTLIGCAVALILMVFGLKPKRYGWCLYFEIGSGWGGLELGPIFLCSKSAGETTKNHEFGHAIQNCYWGPLMIFVISIPSAVRYWFRRILMLCGKTNLPPYDSIWFEGQATRWGTEYMEKSIDIYERVRSSIQH